jgi:hypothetical protein
VSFLFTHWSYTILSVYNFLSNSWYCKEKPNQCFLLFFLTYQMWHTFISFALLCTPTIVWFQAVDFDPDSLRSQLPKAVSALEWAISQCKGRTYVHCTAGLGRAPAVAIAYMFWFENVDVSLFYLIVYRQRYEIKCSYYVSITCSSTQLTRN